jgi:hypothetical protein
MRGGRNKFGSFYKRDRAQRMQQFARRSGGAFSSMFQHHMHLTEHHVSSSTNELSAHPQHIYYQQQHANDAHKLLTPTALKTSSGYDALLQSPTLSSSTADRDHAGIISGHSAFVSSGGWIAIIPFQIRSHPQGP